METWTKRRSTRITFTYVLGRTLLKLGRSEESLATCDGLLRIEPSHVAAVTERRSVLIEAGQYDAAGAEIEKALALDPNYADAHANRGPLHMKLKRKAHALKPGLTGLAGSRVQAKMHCCDWRDFKSNCATLNRSKPIPTRSWGRSHPPCLCPKRME